MDPLADVDAVIAELENERVSLRQQLVVAHGPAAEVLVLGQKMLADKLDDLRARRAVLAERVARTKRTSEVVRRSRALREEVEGMTDAPENGARRAELRALSLELQAEAAALKSG